MAGGSLTNQSEKPGLSVFDRLQSDDVFVVGLLPFESTTDSVELLLAREVERDHFDGMSRATLCEKVRSDLEALRPKLSIVADRLIYTRDHPVERVAKTVHDCL